MHLFHILTLKRLLFFFFFLERFEKYLQDSSVVKATDVLILSWFCTRFNLVENSDVLEGFLSI